MISAIQSHPTREYPPPPNRGCLTRFVIAAWNCFRCSKSARPAPLHGRVAPALALNPAHMRIPRAPSLPPLDPHLRRYDFVALYRSYARDPNQESRLVRFQQRISGKNLKGACLDTLATHVFLDLRQKAREEVLLGLTLLAASTDGCIWNSFEQLQMLYQASHPPTFHDHPFVNWLHQHAHALRLQLLRTIITEWVSAQPKRLDLVMYLNDFHHALAEPCAVQPPMAIDKLVLPSHKKHGLSQCRSQFQRNYHPGYVIKEFVDYLTRHPIEFNRGGVPPWEDVYQFLRAHNIDPAAVMEEEGDRFKRSSIEVILQCAGILLIR
jgi:hypothetical protein